MKKCILLTTAFMGLMVLQGQAQAKVEPATTNQQRTMPTPEEQAERQTQRATKELTLTTDQQKQFKAFTLERINTVKPIHEKMKTTEDKDERKKLHGESKAAQDKFDTSVKGILTAEQLPKWEARKHETLEKRKAHQKTRRENQDSDN